MGCDIWIVTGRALLAALITDSQDFVDFYRV